MTLSRLRRRTMCLTCPGSSRVSVNNADSDGPNAMEPLENKFPRGDAGDFVQPHRLPIPSLCQLRLTPGPFSTLRLGVNAC